MVPTAAEDDAIVSSPHPKGDANRRSDDDRTTCSARDRGSVGSVASGPGAARLISVRGWAVAYINVRAVI
jgi:hypothetical protein